MRIVDKITQAENDNSISYSFEYFPPKTEVGLANLFDRVARMAQMKPAFVSCTWGAGGSTQSKTLELCTMAQNVYGVETLLHLTCTNMEKEQIDHALKEAKNAGIQNILALRGDPPRGHEYWTPCDNGFNHAVDLVRYIREQYGDYFCIGVAGYPDGHVDASSRSQDIAYLKAKVEQGADFILTQLFYDVETFAEWLKECRQAGITVPIVPGIMPIPTYQSFRRMINLCKVHVPRQILTDLDSIKSDDQKVKEYGVSLAVKMIRQLHEQHHVCSFHLSTLNLERSTRLILQELNLVPQELSSVQKLASGEKLTVAAAKISPWSTLQGADRAESWDEFPNGRYGDTRSPAFGENTYGANQLPTVEASSKWGHPKTEDDITQLFVQYILGELSSLPWCEDMLQTETDAIRQRLAQLNRRGYWTVSSQPAVNGAHSQDEVYGWGPKGGYVYQKAFLECFVSEDRLKPLLASFDKDEYITYYAANAKGDFISNVEEVDAHNAVTWGVFSGKEIVQSTIISRSNFEAWKEEAYGLWEEWQRQYPPESDTAKLLKSLREQVWLINVVHNDFTQSDNLFDALGV
ncbi:methylenetetrahydrofolate reductase-domain-containing protein [Radiomyces spectabilis]|uniref:methylenetetrahydrofolate reductase-domain-containing protein n=1 Tax=Radiomyces spectabilis TaxID=64574 RepID=UPI00222051F9|nr:methylenetetrahydrofolate reductase-domain-containing protein [Radiomyces spectabilis]KAI8371619.1 methylenetetrahydrofolate reductase-domain-containing protein [Radiomyces spectabilis]